MKRGRLCLTVVLAGLVLLGGGPAGWAKERAKKAPPEPQHGVVTRVVDGDTVHLADGTVLRLLDINTPEGPHHGRDAEPLADAARDYLRQLVLNQKVVWQTHRRAKDAYGRGLAQIYTRRADGQAGWVNGAMVRAGLAHVYTFADNHQFGPELLRLEDAARAEGRGIWALPRYAVKQADTCCGAEVVGVFQVVDGVVRDVAQVGDRVYLNFGDDWRTDFTAEIQARDAKAFGLKKNAFAAAWFREAYLGKTVRVRGQVRPINGFQVRVTHPLQLEVRK
jgi:micrococcal nuclease